MMKYSSNKSAEKESSGHERSKSPHSISVMANLNDVSSTLTNPKNLTPTNTRYGINKRDPSVETLDRLAYGIKPKVKGLKNQELVDKQKGNDRVNQ